MDFRVPKKIKRNKDSTKSKTERRETSSQAKRLWHYFYCISL